MKSQSYSYSSSSSSSSSSSMFSDGKQKIISEKSHNEQTINNKPTKSSKSFLQLFQTKNKTKGVMGTKKNKNPWELIKINSSKSKRKPKSLRKPRKPKSLRKPKKRGKNRK